TRFSRDWSSDVCSSDLYIINLILLFSHLFRKNYTRLRYSHYCNFPLIDDLWNCSRLKVVTKSVMFLTHDLRGSNHEKISDCFGTTFSNSNDWYSSACLPSRNWCISRSG